MIRYFLQPKFGPWYEVEKSQWQELGLPPERMTGGSMEEYDSGPPILRCVVVNTSTALKADVAEDFPGLEDLIWYPDMRCGECGGRLIDLNENDSEVRFPRYSHATALVRPHGVWPVERW